MRRVTLCCCIVLLASCAKPEQQAAKDSTAGALGAGAAPIALADVAGKWAMRTMAQGSDSVLVSFEMIAGADANGWSFSFPGREPIAVRVLAVDGDSIVTEAGPYASVLRKGVQVSTHSVMRLQDGKIVGTTVATYSSGPDPVITLRTEGTRAQ